MKPRRMVPAWCVVAAIAGSTVTLAEEPPRIDKNPFARPAWETVVDERSPMPLDYTSRASMDLRATMVGAGGSLANVSGKIIGVGETVQGYRLIRVYEDRAVFEHLGNRLTVFVRPPADEKDD